MVVDGGDVLGFGEDGYDCVLEAVSENNGCLDLISAI